MKLEPLKTAKLPKYAAALGLLASVTLLTGCQSHIAAEPTETDEIVELSGKVAFRPDWTEHIVDDPAAAPTLHLDGNITPDYVFRESLETVNRTSNGLAAFYAAGFFTKGFITTSDSRVFDLNGTKFTTVLKHAESGTLFAFYDGTAYDRGMTMRRWMHDACDETYDWGNVLEYPADEDGFHRVIFINAGRDIDNAIAEAEQIYKDVME